MNGKKQPSPGITERPILFNGAMVRAILEGRKTVTRRAIKHQPDVPVTDAIPRRDYPHGPATADWYWRPQHGHLNGVPSHGWDFRCPYGQPGSRLWVRETFATLGNEDGVAIDWNDKMVRGDERHAARIYRASCDVGDYGLWQIPDKAFWKPDTNDMQYEGTWRPSIHMPRWASRILLEITDVRVERLHAITYEEAAAEGLHRDMRMWFATDEGGPAFQRPEQAFAQLWRQTGGDWDANPWVWVVEFKRVEPAHGV